MLDRMDKPGCIFAIILFQFNRQFIKQLRFHRFGVKGKQDLDILSTELLQMIHKLLLIKLIVELCFHHYFEALLADNRIRNTIVTNDLQIKGDLRAFVLSKNKTIKHRKELISVIVIQTREHQHGV